MVKVVGEGEAEVRYLLATAGGGGGAGGGFGAACLSSSGAFSCLVGIGGNGGAGGLLAEVGDGKPGKLSNPRGDPAITPPSGGKHGSLDESDELVAGAGGAGFDCAGTTQASLTGEVGEVADLTSGSWRRAGFGGDGASAGAAGLNGGGGGGGGIVSGAGGGAGAGTPCPNPVKSPWTGGAGGAGGASGFTRIDLVEGDAVTSEKIGNAGEDGTLVVRYGVAAGTPDSTPPTTTLLTKTLGIVTSPTVTARFDGTVRAGRR